MKYYINKNGDFFGFESDGSQDYLITEDMAEITLEEIQTINQAKDDEYRQTAGYKIAEANSYLKETDWVETYKLRHDLGLELIPEESSKWVVINKREEYKVFLKNLEGGN